MSQQFYPLQLLVFLCCRSAQNLLPLSKHVEVHGREQWDVDQHDKDHDQVEVEGEIELVGETDAEDSLRK